MAGLCEGGNEPPGSLKANKWQLQGVSTIYKSELPVLSSQFFYLSHSSSQYLEPQTFRDSSLYSNSGPFNCGPLHSNSGPSNCGPLHSNSGLRMLTQMRTHTRVELRYTRLACFLTDWLTNQLKTGNCCRSFATVIYNHSDVISRVPPISRDGIPEKSRALSSLPAPDASANSSRDVIHPLSLSTARRHSMFRAACAICFHVGRWSFGLWRLKELPEDRDEWKRAIEEAKARHGL
ncbi:hypothetical protein ANN_01515 [Periplaneta americana]|uniref:Uncharacterized protein n=1 Tax=Periplaneta americana TaxID=6978 RepID=A0ABQ8TW79_PERAM|nr:hypothetical protein ANN_01515 [Periplaneta americana]